ncbi:AraC family transcriptional regulator [Lichenibacterium dinghuense]|uniref:AraC family transcriptional regulator n=1 Tax=Lichenibacterium dinghuense TaxID=2895977 RepID=UPI001F1BF72C|nr:AraC family transcriptional regulator [Lichenibacterium sp. 6Y81]
MPHRATRHAAVLPGVEAVSLLSDRSFPRHAHDDFGFGLIDRGAHRSWSGRGPVEAAAGDVITVNPGEMHDGRPIGGARGWRMVYLAPATVADWLGADLPGGTEFARPALRDPEQAALFASAFARLAAPAPDRLAAETALLLCLARLFARHGSRPPRRRVVAPAVALARERIDQAPHLPVTLAELAALAGVGRFQLLRGFARDVGATPHAYLLQARVRAARRRIAAGLPLAEAALAVGFADQSHMTRAFLRQFGVTPGRWRTAAR